MTFRSARHACPKILHQQHQIQVACRRRLESKLPIKGRRFGINRMNNDCSCAHNLRRCCDPHEGILQHCLTQSHALFTLVDRQTRQHYDGHRMTSQPLENSCGCFLPRNAPRCDGVVSDNASGPMNNIGARCLILLVLPRKTLQPDIQRGMPPTIERREIVRAAQRFCRRQGRRVQLTLAQGWRAPSTALPVRECGGRDYLAPWQTRATDGCSKQNATGRPAGAPHVLPRSPG